MRLFEQPLHDEFAGWATGFVSAGGADLGEVEEIAGAMPEGGDDGAYFTAWGDAADRHIEAADAAEKAGHRSTARGHLLRAACFYGVAIHPIYGTPVDPRLARGFERLSTAFERVLHLLETPAEPLKVELDGRALPAWFLPAPVPAQGPTRGAKKPVVIANGGYDSTMADTYLGLGVAAAERGYHVILFDGPGQGALLVGGVPMIPEWERVITAVVDAALERPDVDPARIVLHGWSLGGHLAARAATGEHRLAACIADPASWRMREEIVGMLTKFGLPDAAADPTAISDADAAKLTATIEADRDLRWMIVQRGYWVMGATDVRSFITTSLRYTLDGRGEIRCPFVATKNEGDPLSLGADAFVARLTAPARVLDFTKAEGAAGHCELQNRWLLNQRVLDWLDDTLAS